jgi:DNA repair photolyase
MVGAAGTLAVMSRATLGHSGQQFTASAATQAIYVAITVAALSRICPVIEPAHSEPLLHLAALAWAAAFFGFALSFGPLLVGAGRRKSEPKLAAWALAGVKKTARISGFRSGVGKRHFDQRAGMRRGLDMKMRAVGFDQGLGQGKVDAGTVGRLV